MTPAPRRVSPHGGGATGQGSRNTWGGRELGLSILRPLVAAPWGRRSTWTRGPGGGSNSWAASRDPLDTPRYEVTERPRGMPARPAFTVTSWPWPAWGRPLAPRPPQESSQLPADQPGSTLSITIRPFLRSSNNRREPLPVSQLQVEGGAVVQG